MTIRVEFFGIPRQRAGQFSIVLPLSGPVLLKTVFHELAARFPGLATECLHGDRLQPGYVANIDGKQFVCDPDTLLANDTCLLIMSADAGG